MTNHICVIGGGVIGLATAYALVRDGCRVTLVEAREDVGLETSHANGGQLSYRFVAPLADAGVPLKALGWMCRGDSPLLFRPRLDSAQWRWSLAFLKACRRSVNVRNSAHLLRLALYSQQIMAQWRDADALGDYRWRANGKLVIYRSPGSFAQARAAVMDPAQTQVLDPEECLRREPSLVALTGGLVGGTFSLGDEVADCQLFCVRLLERLRHSGRFQLVAGRAITAFDRRGDRVQAARLGAEAVMADGFVMAAGIRSVALVRPLGIRLPLYPLKGYSLTLPLRHRRGAPETNVTDFDHKVVYARLGEHLRIAAMVDMVGHDSGLNQQRIALLRRRAREMFPEAGNYADARPWAGMRPATPTGTPLLGGTPLRNLWLNVGHGALGFTLACASAQVLSDVIRGRNPCIGLNGLTL